MPIFRRIHRIFHRQPDYCQPVYCQPCPAPVSVQKPPHQKIDPEHYTYKRFSAGINTNLLRQGYRTLSASGKTMFEPTADGRVEILKRGSDGIFRKYGIGRLQSDGTVLVRSKKKPVAEPSFAESKVENKLTENLEQALSSPAPEPPSKREKLAQFLNAVTRENANEKGLNEDQRTAVSLYQNAEAWKDQATSRPGISGYKEFERSFPGGNFTYRYYDNGNLDVTIEHKNSDQVIHAYERQEYRLGDDGVFRYSKAYTQGVDAPKLETTIKNVEINPFQ